MNEENPDNNNISKSTDSNEEIESGTNTKNNEEILSPSCNLRDSVLKSTYPHNIFRKDVNPMTYTLSRINLPEHSPEQAGFAANELRYYLALMTARPCPVDAEPAPGARDRVEQVLRIMLTAWAAARLREQAEMMVKQLKQVDG